MNTLNLIKLDLVSNNIKDNITITKSTKHYFLDIKGKNKDIFRVFESLEYLKKYLYSIYKIEVA